MRTSPVPVALLCTLVLGLVVTLSTLAHGSSVAVDVQISKYFSLQPSSAQTARARSTANDACKDAGGSLIADYNLESGQAMVQLCADAGVGKLCTSFLDGDATPPPSNNLLNCEENQGKTTTGNTVPNSEYCYYRFRFGFFDSISFAADKDRAYFLPGTCYHRGMYIFGQIADPTWNGYYFAPWNTTDPDTTYPHGYYSTIGGVNLDTNTYVRMDTPVPPVDQDPNPLTSYYVTCSVQAGRLPEPTTSTKPPQPPVILGKGPWAQRYWWVIFIIVAVVLLILLFVLLICCTRRILANRANERNVTNPVENSIVLRERRGSAYINVDETVEVPEEGDDDMEPKSRGVRMQGGGQQQQQQYPGMMMPMYPAGGMVDPSDYMQGLPRVYSQGEVSMTADNEAFAEDEYHEGDDGNEDGEADNGDDDHRVVRRVSSTRSMEEAERGGAE